ncbi:MAG: hypothetical protein Q4E13_02555 [Clostridia bacterium]|nr:hypothetical protein [Clostridia bacterium]
MKKFADKYLTKPVLISALVALAAGIIQLILNIMRDNGLELINQSIYYVFTGVIISAVILMALFILIKIPKTKYVSRMFTILAIVMIVTVWLTVYMWSPYLPYHYATCENAGNKVAIMRHFTLDPEVSERLNAASAQYMADAEAAAAEAQANGEAVEEVANTVVDTELLCSYAAYPIRMGLFYDRNADIDGNVYTLFGATSAQIMIDWPQDHVAHLYVEGAEGEGESTTTLK